ncbi:MAG: gas vesicle protein GvpK, partial [Chloroflexota bacterium]
MILDHPLQDSPPRALGNSPRITLDPENVRNGLGKLVLTVVELVRELLERQA